MFLYGVIIIHYSHWKVIIISIYNYIIIMMCYLCDKLLVACLVTPALWQNFSDSMNILIIHLGLLLKERILDSIGHDLWKKYNVICLL